jgi:[ribosomal protein S18]-alanine N-acetyltransferase
MAHGAFRLVAMTDADARAVAAWQYPPPYDGYTIGADEADEFVAMCLDPAFHYYAVLDAADNLVAFRCFGADAQVPGGDYAADALDMGGGLRPDLTGRGLGPQVMRAALDFARQTFAPTHFRATVAAWNVRAQRACHTVGYRQVSAFETADGRPFVILMRPAHPALDDVAFVPSGGDTHV